MRRFLLLSAALTACGPVVSTKLVETHAESIEQPAPGLSLLAAAPIPRDRTLQLTLGAAHTPSQAPGHGGEGAALYVPPSGVAGHLMFALGEQLELGLALRGATKSRVEAGSGIPPAPDGERPTQAGVRLRGFAGQKVLRLGYAAELGVRTLNLAYGPTVSCEADQVGGEWVRIDGECEASRQLLGRSFESTQPYLALALYPTLRLSDGVYLYAGGTLDQVTVGYERVDRVTEYQYGAAVLETEEEAYRTEAVFLPIAGLDVQLDDTFGLIFMVKGPPLGAVDLAGPIYEGALTLSF